MTTTIALNPRGTVGGVTDPSTLATALLVNGYAASRVIRNQVHAIIGTAEPSYTLRDAGPRSGTITYVFADQTQASRCEVIHSRPGVITVTDPDLPGGHLSYIATEQLDILLDADSAVWLVSCGFLEVT